MKLISTSLVLGLLVAGCSDLAKLVGDDSPAAAATPLDADAGGATPAAGGSLGSSLAADAAASSPGSSAGTPSGDTTTLRVVHASPDAPAVDVYAEGVAVPIFQGLVYGDTSASIDLPAGSYNVQLRASPSMPSDPIVYQTGLVPLAKGKKTMAIAAGLLGSKNADDTFRVLTVEEGGISVGLGNTAVRIVHASPDAPTVGIDVGNDDPTAPEVAEIQRFATVGSVSLPSDTSLQLGIDAANVRVTAFTTPKLPNGVELTVIATGLVGKLPHDPAGFALLAVGPNGTVGFIRQNPFVYALHGGVDAPAVDVCVGGTKVIDNLIFGKIAGPLQVPAGDLALDLFAHGATGTPAASAKLTLASGERYLAIATGYLAPPTGGQPFTVLAFAEGFEADAANARARIVHASPNAPAVDVGPVTGTTLTPAVTALSFGSATAAGGLALPPPMLDIGIAPEDQDGTLVGNYATPTPAGSSVFAVAAGAIGHPTRPLRLALVNTAPTPWTVSHIFTH